MTAAKKNAKATKKFEKKHLKGVLEQRKATAKIKQRQQVKTKKQAKRAKDAEFYKGAKDGESLPTNGRRVDANVSEMSVDDFFKGGFEILAKVNPAQKRTGGKLGKRKRDGPEEVQDDSASSELDLGEDREPIADDGEGESENGGDESMGMTKESMAALAKDDPEFHQFLKENDPDLLKFDEDVDLAEIDELSGSEDEEQPKKKRKKEKKKAKGEEDDSDAELAADNELTRSMIAAWKRSMTEKHSLRAARQVVLAFRSAAHLNEDEDGTKTQRYTISSPDVYHDVLTVALKQIPEVLQHHVPVKDSASGKVYVSTDSKKFKTLSILMRSYTASVLHLLGALSDDATLKLTISALTPLLPYLLSFRKLLKVLIKTVVSFWSQSSSSESTRITSFLVLRRLCVIGDKGIRETVLKATYQGLIQGSRTTNANTIQGINLMKNSAAELWGIDQGIGYTTAFTFIRQLAIHLRNSIVNNQNDSYKKVYNWQYVHSLDFWSRVLSEHCNSLKEAEAGKESQLRLLIYPVVQVTLGAMRLIPTASYFPLRFQLVRSLLRLSRATGTYIPLASALLEVLNSAEMKRAPKSGTLRPLDFATAYRAPKSYLRTRIYQDGVGDQVVELLAEYLVLWATNIAFPEFSLPVAVMVKRWLKDARRKRAGNNNARLVSALAVLVQKVEASGRFVEERRAKVDFAPKDRAQVDAFMRGFPWEETPLGAYVVGQRKMRAERQRVMEEARREEDVKRKEEEQRELDGGEDEVEDDEEESDGGVQLDDDDNDDEMEFVDEEEDDE